MSDATPAPLETFSTERLKDDSERFHKDVRTAASNLGFPILFISHNRTVATHTNPVSLSVFNK